MCHYYRGIPIWPHFRGWYVQASMELAPEDVSLLERCPHFRGVVYTGFMHLYCTCYHSPPQIMVIAGVFHGDESLCANGQTRAMNLEGG